MILEPSLELAFTVQPYKPSPFRSSIADEGALETFFSEKKNKTGNFFENVAVYRPEMPGGSGIP